MNKTLPIATVVIPTYNYAGKVCRAIESVMKQTTDNFECIISDDGSTDDTEQVVRDFIKDDKRFHYYKFKNGGVSTARNRGISKGVAPFICCLDADDAIEPQFLETCLKPLIDNLEYSISYTGIKLVTSDGREGASRWPGKFDFSRQIQGENQIPTCCVFRRVMWERLGGYRSRYCPHGAGSEDAEFWIRAGAHGFNAIQVTEGPLFVYSYRSGRVSGDPNYVEINWISSHPWTSDMKHPFPSIFTPRRHSHPVHQYDTPVVSVIIPVGPRHRETLFDALDSLEGQTFRDWEAVVVDDSGVDGPFEFNGFPDAMSAYPYVRLFKTEGKKGAGYARNIGAKEARAPLLLFLDADDMLIRDALEEMVISWGIDQQIVYSDYAGKAVMDKKDVDTYPHDDILYYDEISRQVVLRHRAAEFDCAQAIQEPTKKMYIWNLITSLVPKVWHDEINGFDESMSAWEDWDYWIRMARAGKCFTLIRKPLVVYRFYTGTRREQGLQDYQNLLQYMINKQGEIPMSNCGCGNKSNQPSPVKVQNAQMRKEENSMNIPSDNNIVLCVYTHPNIGQHRVTGAITRTNYGYRGGGERFYVDRRDIAAQPNLFRIIEETVRVPEPSRPLEPVAAPKPVDVSPNIIEHNIDDISNLPGITPGIRAQLNANNVHTVQELENFGEDGIISLKGVGKTRAQTIMAFVKEYQAKKK